MILDIYEQILKDYMADQKLVCKGKIREVRYEEFEKNPLETVKNIYSGFAMGEFEKVKPSFEAFLDGQKKHAPYVYQISRKELDLVMERLEFAMDYWDYGLPGDIEILEE